MRKKGFVGFESQFAVSAGEWLNVKAPLPPEKPALVTRWWLWTIVGGAATGIGAGAWYVATRPGPLFGGGTDWFAPIR